MLNNEGRSCVDLYNLIHKYVRSEINKITVLAGSTDFFNEEESQSFKKAFFDLIAFLTDHSNREDTYIHPLLGEIESLDLRSIEKEHISLGSCLTQLKAAIEKATTRSEFNKFYLDFVNFQAKYYLHLDEEERKLMPELQNKFTDEILQKVSSDILASMPKESMLTITKSMLPVINHQERVEIFKGMKAKMPPMAFEGICELAKSVLTESQTQSLFSEVISDA